MGWSEQQLSTTATKAHQLWFRSSRPIAPNLPALVIIKVRHIAFPVVLPRAYCFPMTPASQAANPVNLPVPAEGLAHGHINTHVHAPQPGATAPLIHDLRELFKVK